MEIIIGLIGAKGSGKTTAFNAMKDAYPEIVELTLAGKLKDVCSQVFGIPREYFDSHNFKEKELDNPVYLTIGQLQNIFEAYDANPNYDTYLRPHVGKILLTPRQIAQYVGTEVLRTISHDIHCEFCVKGKTGRIGVVTDIRFPNELAYFKSNYVNFYPLYIKNTGAELAASQDGHRSESYYGELSAQALIFSADDTLEELKKKAVRTLRDILEENNKCQGKS